eukprot:6758878-Alexandrium_andersonii.AAC.1
MSASLVGSEMCIRDSARPLQGFARWMLAWIGGSCWTRARADPASALLPVSYTHLRCRRYA